MTLFRLALAFRNEFDTRIYDALRAGINDVFELIAMTYNMCLWAFVSYLSLYLTVTAQDLIQPYAQPSGLADDITQWLAVSTGSQISTCKAFMLANINVEGATPGTVVASTSRENPNYHYNCK